MPVLEIRLLGTPTVSWDAAPQAIVRRQTRALLYRLAVPGPPLTRDHLCFLLWPDVAEATASRNLSHLLTHLRLALPDGDALLTAQGRVWLDARKVWTDVGEFLHLRGFHDGIGDAGRLVRAVELYRGPFLDGVCAPNNAEYESWLILERRTLERRYRDTLHALVEEFSARGELEQAIRFANRCLDTDRLDETIHQRLITLYAERGDRAAALRQYAQCKNLLDRELGVHPLPETQALHEALCSEPESIVEPHTPAPRWTTLPGPRLPLIGRDDAWRILQDLYARAAGGRGAVALVSGEGGSGKSRLLEQFVTHSPARALVAAGLPGTESLPFHVLIQAIRPHLGIGGPPGHVLTVRLQRMPAVWLAEAERVLPELAGERRVSSKALPSPSQEAYGRSRLFESLSRVVMALAADECPALLCLDDLQWADDETLGWLAYFAPQIQRAHLLVLAACRGDGDQRLASLRRALSRLGLLAEIELRGLAATDLAELLACLTEQESPDCDCPGERFVSRLLDATGGNPHCAIQVVMALRESALPMEQWAEVDELPAPASLCKAVGERLGALDPVSRQVVEACAILGPVFGFDAVRLTSGRRELETLDSLEKLVMCGLLECQGAEYRFRQVVARRILENGMSSMRRQLLHRRAGRALEQVNRHALDAIAHHYEAANEPAKAARFREAAARRTEVMFAAQEAEEYGVRPAKIQLH